MCPTEASITPKSKRYHISHAALSNELAQKKPYTPYYQEMETGEELGHQGYHNKIPDAHYLTEMQREEPNLFFEDPPINFDAKASTNYAKSNLPLFEVKARSESHGYIINGEPIIAIERGDLKRLQHDIDADEKIEIARLDAQEVKIAHLDSMQRLTQHGFNVHAVMKSKEVQLMSPLNTKGVEEEGQVTQANLNGSDILTLKEEAVTKMPSREYDGKLNEPKDSAFNAGMNINGLNPARIKEEKVQNPTSLEFSTAFKSDILREQALTDARLATGKVKAKEAELERNLQLTSGVEQLSVDPGFQKYLNLVREKVTFFCYHSEPINRKKRLLHRTI